MPPRHKANLAVARAGTPCRRACRRQDDVRIQWFDDPTVGMRYSAAKPKSPVTISGALPPNSIRRRRKILLQRVRRFGHTAATAMRLAAALRSSGPQSLLGLGVDELRWLAPVRPGVVLRIEGEVIELTPSRTKSQGTVRVKWTVNNQNDEAVLTFIPTVIVPRRKDASGAYESRLRLASTNRRHSLRRRD
jgi:hypothetical protein